MPERNETALLKLVREAFVVLGENTEALKEAKAIIEDAKRGIESNKKKLVNLRS